MANKRNILAVHRIRETRQKYGMSWCAYAHTLVMQSEANEVRLKELNGLPMIAAEIQKSSVMQRFINSVG